jgi:putative membrane protein
MSPKLAMFAGAFLATVAIGPLAFADSPQDFLTKAIQGDNSEIMLGKLAQQNGGSAGVRDYGRMLVTDHTKARNQVVALARKQNVTPTDAASDEGNQERDKLAGLHGADFDKEFVRFAIEEHQKDITEFEDEAKENHGAVSALAKQQLPVLRKHLSMAQKLQH